MDREEKTRAFRLYDFEGNGEWREYFKRVDISGGDYNEKLLKLKGKWYRREVDSAFELEWLRGIGNTSREAKPSMDETRASTSEPNKAGGSAMNNKPPFVLTLLHFLLVITGALSMVPLIPRIVQRTFLQLVIVSAFLKTYQQFGLPKFRPLSELKRWAGRVVNTTDCHYGFLALMFLSRPVTLLIFIPPTVLAVYHAIVYLESQFRRRSLWVKYGAPLHHYLVSNSDQALVMNAMCEIATGFILIGQLVIDRRNILLLFLYWQWLRARYMSPDSAWIHRQVWATLGRRVEPLLRRLPFLRMPLKMIANWFKAGS